MRVSFAPMIVLGLLGVIGFAAVHDLAMMIGAALQPWFGWMLP